MKFVKVVPILAIALLAAVLTVSFAPLTAEAKSEKRPTIYKIAKANPDFETLVGALEATGLDKVVDSNQKLTVFAPTDAAFDALKAEIGEDAFNQVVSDKEALTNVLLYHVAHGRRMSNSVVSAERIRMLDKGFVLPSVNNGEAFLTDENGRTVKIIAVDIQASDGVIHVIDNVLLPK